MNTRQIEFHFKVREGHNYQRCLLPRQQQHGDVPRRRTTKSTPRQRQLSTRMKSFNLQLQMQKTLAPLPTNLVYVITVVAIVTFSYWRDVTALCVKDFNNGYCCRHYPQDSSPRQPQHLNQNFPPSARVSITARSSKSSWSRDSEDEDEEQCRPSYDVEEDVSSVNEARRRQDEINRIRRKRHRNLENWGVENLQPISKFAPSPKSFLFHESELGHDRHEHRHTSHQDVENASYSPQHQVASFPACPSTFEGVANDAFCAIAGTICGLQRPDPNVAGNAMHRSVLDYRPTHPPLASSRRWVNGDEDFDDGNIENARTDGSAKSRRKKKRNSAVKKKTLISNQKKMKETCIRMGIEIDGAAYLLPSNPQRSVHNHHPLYDSSVQHQGHDTEEGRAMRILSLELAKRLAIYPWQGFEDIDKVEDSKYNGDYNDENAGIINSSSNSWRTVAVYYNSMEQTLLASRELRRWKHLLREGAHYHGLGLTNKIELEALEHIHICCLGQHSLPSSMIKDGRQTKKHDKKSTKVTTTLSSKSSPNSKKGIVLVVKPTDYDIDFPIPNHHNHNHSNENTHSQSYHPAIHTNIVEKLQSILLQASASSLPAIVMTPRLSELPPLQQNPYLSSLVSAAPASPTSHANTRSSALHRTGPSGFEQSGYQKSATYGGMEPPVGPTPWLLRDLAPPIYVWVGCSLDVSPQYRNSGGATSSGRDGRLSRNDRSDGMMRRRIRRKLTMFPSRRATLATYLLHQRQMELKKYDNDGGLRGNHAISKEEENNHTGKRYSGGLDDLDKVATYSFYSRVALTQSAMTTGHSWHLFAVKENVKMGPPSLDFQALKSSKKNVISRVNNSEMVEWDSSYQYMASIKASSGRPNIDIIKDVFAEWYGDDIF